MVDYIVPAHQSDEFDSFNPDALDIFEENEIEIFKDVLRRLNSFSYFGILY